MSTSYFQLLRFALPEVIVVATALLVLAVDLLLLRRQALRARFAIASILAVLGCVAAIAALLLAPAHGSLYGDMLLANPLVHWVQIALLALTIVTLLLSIDSSFTTHVGEFVLLVLLATTGMLFLVATLDLLVIFTSLELLSLSLYVMTAFDKENARSSEAALKYFLFGGMSAACLLFGFSIFYGLSNSTSLVQIAAAVHGVSPLLVIAIVTTLIGFGFKVAAAPFHFWAPDVYESAPVPAAAFIASASKVASFFVFFELMALGLAGASGSAAWGHFSDGWVPAVAAVAAASMLLGNLVAIVQSRVRRLLAYSAVAHAGYMLIAVIGHTQQSLAAMLYYVVTYGLATAGALGVIGVVERNAGDDRLDSFNGLSRRAPLLAACLFVFLLSLAGIPPLAGFFGKFYLFVSALHATPGAAGLLWLVVLAIAMSAVSLYYYLQVLKRAFATAPAVEGEPLHVPAVTQAVVALLALSVVLFGCVPSLLLHWIEAAMAASGW
jgi:NADH-quinone oxidoreductase subunit N